MLFKMSDRIILRIKHSAGQFTINDLNSDTTIDELRSKLASVTKIPQSSIRLLHGFPPKQIAAVSESATLSSLNLRSGDALLVEGDVSSSNPDEMKGTAKSGLDGAMKQSKGLLTRRVVPANNSCLFTSVDFVMNGGRRVVLDSARPMRQLIAKIVSSDQEMYNSAFLSQTNSAYRTWIMNDENWGGAIELSILSQYYQIEIAVIDCETGRIDRYSEDKHFPTRVFLIYDGIHYDPIALETPDGAVLMTLFSTGDFDILSQAMEIGAEARESKKFTNIASGSYKCLVCGVVLPGEASLQSHTMQTKHINFAQV